MTWRPEFWGASHPGLRRDRNEDAFLWMGPEQLGDDSYLWLVCDGMGGEAAGELASSAVAERVREVYPRALQAYQNPHRALTEALDAANRRLRFMQETKAELRKMGSTAVAVALFHNQLWTAYVGDSRLYTYGDRQLQQQTTDHTKFQRMIEAGVLTAADDRPDHPGHSVLLNVLGRPEMEVETIPPISIPAEGLSLLLCSDGLSSFVDATQLSAALSQATPQDAVQFLLSSALPRSNDNITLQVIRFGSAERPAALDALARAHDVTLQALPSSARQTSSLPFGELAAWERHQTGSQPRVSQSAGDIDTPVPADAPADAAPAVPSAAETPDAAANPMPDEARQPRGTMLFSAEALRAAASPTDPQPLSPQSEPPSPKSAAPDAPAADAPASSAPAPRSGTLLLGADEIERALASETTPAAAQGPAQGPAQAPAPSPAAKEPVIAPASTHKAQRLHVGDTPDGGRDGDGGDVDEGGTVDATPIGRELHAARWLLALAVVLALVAVVIALLQLLPSPQSPPEVSAGPGAPAGDEALTALPRRDAAAARSAYQEAASPRPPDRRHVHDAMPAYAVRGGAWALDAHEVTLAQLLRVAEADDALNQLVDADRVLFEDLACPSDIAVDAHMPACASLPTATRYCAQVERRLPSSSDWRGLSAEDDALLARGYTAAAEDAAHELVVVPPFVRAISGSFDGSPELLAPNDAQRRAGDLVLLQPHGDARITVLPRAAREMSEANTNPVGPLSFRCIAATAGAEVETSPTPAAAPTPAAVPAPAPTPPLSPAPSRAAAAPVAPRVNPAPETVEDPDVSDDSFLLQRLRTP